MNISRSALTVVLAVLLPGALVAQEGKSTLGITKVVTTAGLSNKLALGTSTPLGQILQSLDSQLEVAVSATRKFQVVAIKDLSEVLNKQDLAASGNFDPRGAGQSGRLESAKYIVLVEIDQFHESFRQVGIEPPKTQPGLPGAAPLEPAPPAPILLERSVHLHAVAKIYDTTSGGLFEAVNIATKKSEINGPPERENYISSSGAGDPLLRELTRETAHLIALRVVDTVFPLKVLSKRDQFVTLNRGEGAGVSPGQMWDVYAVGQPLIDEDTQEFLGLEEVMIGKARIITVQPKMAIAELVEDRGVQKGSILRTPLPAPPPVDPGQATAGSATRTVLFGFLRWGDHLYAAGVGPAGKGELAKTMRAAAYKAMQNAQAVALEDPTYVISKRNLLFLQRYKVEARGFGRRTPGPQPVPAAPVTSGDATREAQLRAEALARSERERQALEAVMAETEARLREEERLAREAAEKAEAAAKVRREQERLAAENARVAAAQAREQERLAREAEKLREAAEAKARREQERMAAEAAKAAAAQAQEEERRTAAALKAQQEELAREQARQRAIAEQEAAKARAAAGLAGPGKPLTPGQIQRLANLYTSYSSNQISFGKYQRERARIINE